MLSQILHKSGIESAIVERRSREHVEGRIRAGVLEQGTVDLLHETGAGRRMAEEGLVHDGIGLCTDGVLHRIDLRALTGKSVTIYGQTELTKDLIEVRLAEGGPIDFSADAVSIHAPDSPRPAVTYTHEGQAKRLDCDFIAGCDGFHGVSRSVLPGAGVRSYSRSYPFAWLGILAEAPPPSDELIYVRSERGFALFSMRSRSLSRSYLQCDPDEDLEQWPDDRVWSELRRRLGPAGADRVRDGPVLEKGVTQMRSFVVEPMQHGQLFLAGDAAHIVPPTGAKGLNLAAADVRYLAAALIEFYRSGSRDGLDRYTATALVRVWKAQRFSSWMTSLMHTAPADDAFQNRLHAAELDYLLGSAAAMTSLAENYVGLPL